MENSLI